VGCGSFEVKIRERCVVVGTPCLSEPLIKGSCSGAERLSMQPIFSYPQPHSYSFHRNDPQIWTRHLHIWQIHIAAWNATRSRVSGSQFEQVIASLVATIQRKFMQYLRAGWYLQSNPGLRTSHTIIYSTSGCYN
jgi:hypothetical protein